MTTGVVDGVSHVSIYVSDMERSLAFYREVFGFETIFESLVDGPALETITGVEGASLLAVGGRIGDLRVELMQSTTVPATPKPPGLGLAVLSFEVADAAEAHERVVALGYRCPHPPVEHYGTRMFFVLDPDGQGIEMVEYIPGGGAWGDTYAIAHDPDDR